jgi:uncharacterized repeat protein (TIGR02543 family)
MISFGNWSNEEIVRGVKEVILRYDANGGINAPSAQIRIEGENLVIADTKPVREGYKFVGWSTKKDSDEVSYYPGDILEDDVDILYAKWLKEDEENIEILEPEINTDIVIQETQNSTPKVELIPTETPSATPKAEVIPEAKEEKIKITITFRIDEKNSTTKEVIYKEKYGELPIPEKDGYDFEGWYLDKEYRDEITSETIVENKEAHDVYPKWTAKTYEVSFELNGGAEAGASVRPVSVTYDTAYGILPTVERTGYTFNGWYLDSETFKNRIDGSSIVKTAGDHTLYAKWVANEYIVVFELNGGTVGVGVSDDPIKVTYDSPYGELPIAVAKGYTFDGWYLDNETFKEKVTEDTIVKKAELHRLYAGWKINKYEVTFELNGGVIIGDDSEKINVTYNSEYGELPNVEKEGYTFGGWYLDNGTFENEITENTILVIDENHTIYVKWIANEYEASFELNGGVGVADPITVAYDTAYGELPSPTKEGYTFNGWHLDDETYRNRVDSNSIVKTAENHILYAKWIANEYEVTFDVGTGVLGDSMMVTYDSTYGELPSPTKEGYTFRGWYLDGETFNDEIESSSMVTIDKNHTLYARWGVNKYTASFELNGGVGLAEPIIVTYDAAYGELPNPTKEGYTFNGWYLENLYVNMITSNSIVTKTEEHILYAKWVANEYIVSFNSNGGSSAEQKLVTYDEAYGELPSPTKTGYTFEAWYLDSSLTNRITSTSIMNTSRAHTLYAKWVANKYEVTFSTNGGSAVESKEVTYDSSYGTLTASTKTGYTFEGWYKESSLVNKITSSSTVTTASNHTLYAKFEPIKYTVSYNANGGTGAPNSEQAAYDSTYTLSSTVPTRSGYTFLGWDTNEGVTTPAYSAGATNRITIKGAIALHAIWKANTYTVSFNTDGGTLSGSSSITVTYGSTYGSLPTATKTGYTFSGWKYSSSSITSSTTVSVASNHTLVAAWTANTYTVSFNSDGGSTVSSKSVTYNSTYGTLAGPTKRGYDFGGWYTTSSLTGLVTSSSTVTIAANHTLYAKWTAKTYTLTYEVYGGTLSGSSSKTITYDSTYGTLATASKSGYTFGGWYLESTFSTLITASSTVSVPDSVTSVKLYAKLTANSYTITYNANGGSSAPSSQTANYGSSVTLRSTSPTRSSYTFLGWSASSTATSATYSAGQTITMPLNGLNLYAVWKLSAYTVTLYDGVTNQQIQVTPGQTLNLSSYTRTPTDTSLVESPNLPFPNGITVPKVEWLGWSTVNITKVTTKPTSIIKSYTPVRDTTLYSVGKYSKFDTHYGDALRSGEDFSNEYPGIGFGRYIDDGTAIVDIRMTRDGAGTTGITPSANIRVTWNEGSVYSEVSMNGGVGVFKTVDNVNYQNIDVRILRGPSQFIYWVVDVDYYGYVQAM